MLSGQVAVVTGASGSIGGAIALELARQGCTVCALGRRLESLETLTETLRTSSPRSKSYVLDLTSDDDLEGFSETLDKDFGETHILVHAAGSWSAGALSDTPVEVLDRHHRLNTRAPYLLTQKLLSKLIQSRGQIVFIGSSVNPGASPGLTQYGASKQALQAIADGLRAEINELGVRVITIQPGRTASPIQEQAHARAGQPYRPDELMQPRDVGLMVAASLDLPRTAEVTEVNLRPMLKGS